MTAPGDDDATLGSLLPAGASLDRVLDEYARLVERKTRPLTPSPAPLFLNVSGIPGAGKSTLAAKILLEDPSMLYLSFDELMEALAGYREDFQRLGAAAAFERWELPARHLGYRLLREAVARRYPILFEHGNATPSHVALYRRLKRAGYRVEIRFLDADVPTALKRVRRRERSCPEALVVERAALLRELNETYKEIVDKFETIRS
jgi:predicted kinase